MATGFRSAASAEPLLAGGRGDDLVAVARQVELHHLADLRVVVDDQDGALPAGGGRGRGSPFGPVLDDGRHDDGEGRALAVLALHE